MIPKIKILYEDAEILAVNKPAGLLVHPPVSFSANASKDKQKTLTSFLLEKYPKIKNVGDDPTRPGIVHRLDKETSGVLVVAKTQRAFDFLKKQFKNHTVKKKYLAIVWGKPKRERGIIDTPIGRSKKDARKRQVGIASAGKLREAVTEYKVIKRIQKNSSSSPPAKGEMPKAEGVYSLLEIYPRTGRTHQIRVHLASIGHPVVGDSLYAPSRPNPAGVKRLALHAVSIKFKNLAGKEIKIEAPIPPDLFFAKIA